MALTNKEMALSLANKVRAHRVAQGLSQRDAAERSGISTTSLSRFERTGAITLNNLISLFRALGLAQRIEDLAPEYEGPSPLEVLDASRQGTQPAGLRARRAAKDT